ncbi:antiporter/ drug transporter/ transporter [Iris pallida]|uniref:ribonuclease P n=1 Tax=Iris pallida TaxID=29817 RepID=A0AAX6E3F0_IRIPA|nr:antiporter/ drug transporter/ transporter [Iris pallida]
MPLAGFLPCSSLILRHHSPLLLSFLSKTLSFPLLRHSRHYAHRPLSSSSSSLRHNIKHHHRTMTTTTTTTTNPNPNPNPRPRKKSRNDSPEYVLRHRLGLCSRDADLDEALRLYDAARADSVPLSLDHYNPLLYLCALGASSTPSRGFEIYDQMLRDGVAPNEATFTSLARIAAVEEKPELAFDLVRKMQSLDIPPRLRSYGPALFGFCKKGDFLNAHEVENHMEANGIVPEESELAALLKVNADSERGEDVYRVLQRMRGLVRRVTEETAGPVEEWFRSDAAEGVGVEEWDEGKVREGVRKGGGGWHGVGWLGKGRWNVGRSEMDGDGVCRTCGEKLVCIDIDPVETREFASSLANLACQREVRTDFVGFQEWLDRHGPFDAVVDGANVGLYSQHNFSFFQLNSVVNGLRQMSPSKKLPLVILHSRRVKGGPADTPNNKRLIESWRRAGALYTTPNGSNDDWYWLYAAVSCGSLLVTNDEMRDHLFELLGTSFFPRWKEKHQVRLTYGKHGKQGPNFHMPPPYSIVIQESERGSWHIPTVSGDDIETPRQWVCATRDANAVSSSSCAKLAHIAS